MEESKTETISAAPEKSAEPEKSADITGEVTAMQAPSSLGIMPSTDYGAYVSDTPITPDVTAVFPGY